MTYTEQQEAITAAIAQQPKEFKLKAYPGKIFSIDRMTSFYSTRYGIQLYVFVHTEEGPLAFCKATPEELARQIA